MFSNFAPHRPKTGWGRRRLQNPTGFTPVVNHLDDIAPTGAATDLKTLPILCRWSITFRTWSPLAPYLGSHFLPQRFASNRLAQIAAMT